MTIPESFGPLGARLYHYTKLATALEDIVPNQTLKLGPFSSMRDPRESQDWAIMTAGFGELALEDFVPPSVELNRIINDLKSHGLRVRRTTSIAVRSLNGILADR